MSRPYFESDAAFLFPSLGCSLRASQIEGKGTENKTEFCRI